MLQKLVVCQWNRTVLSGLSEHFITVFTVTLDEVDFRFIDSQNDDRLSWPKQVSSE